MNSKFITAVPAGLAALRTVSIGLAILCANALCIAEMPARRKSMPLKSGPMVGDHVASFYTRAVTGPLMNKSVCYVCRNGQRPVVMVLLRRVDAELKPLMKSLDKLVDGNRAVGLRGFGVLIDNNSVQATSAVQTFAFDNKISIPLTISGEAVAAASGQKG